MFSGSDGIVYIDTGECEDWHWSLWRMFTCSLDLVQIRATKSTQSRHVRQISALGFVVFYDILWLYLTLFFADARQMTPTTPTMPQRETTTVAEAAEVTERQVQDETTTTIPDSGNHHHHHHPTTQ